MNLFGHFQSNRLTIQPSLLLQSGGKPLTPSPPTSIIKVNLDGAVFKENEEVGIGVIIWN